MTSSFFQLPLPQLKVSNLILTKYKPTCLHILYNQTIHFHVHLLLLTQLHALTSFILLFYSCFEMGARVAIFKSVLHYNSQCCRCRDNSRWGGSRWLSIMTDGETQPPCVMSCRHVLFCQLWICWCSRSKMFETKIALMTTDTAIVIITVLIITPLIKAVIRCHTNNYAAETVNCTFQRGRGHIFTMCYNIIGNV